MKKILIERDICKVLRERDNFLDSADVKVFTAASNDEMLQLHLKPPVLLAKAKLLLDINWKETYRVQLSAFVAGNKGDGAYFYRSLDITTTEILRETNQTFHHDDCVFCSFVLPDTTPVRTMGEAVRTIKQPSAAITDRCGIHFVDLAPEANKAIENYLDAKAL